MRYAFAGDRLISCEILTFIISKGYSPLALLVSNKDNNTHAESLLKISGLAADELVFWGNEFKQEDAIIKLKRLNLDYVIGIHFPKIIPAKVLRIPSIGFINLHPAYLPFNKGWHTPSWAILDKTKYGATLHFMDEKLDEGDIIHQKQLLPETWDTADTLYSKVLEAEKEVFYEAFDDLKSLSPQRIKQFERGTSHSKINLENVREIDMKSTTTTSILINKLKALTTNSWNESAYFVEMGKKIGIQITLKELDE